MNYRVLLERSAQKALELLSREVRERIYSALTSLSRNPRPPGCKKLKESNYWRLRVGDYRTIYEIDDAARVVLVLRIAHRSEVYR